MYYLFKQGQLYPKESRYNNFVTLPKNHQGMIVNQNTAREFF